MSEEQNYKKIDGGVTAAKGYKANGIACGVKQSGNKDLALIVSETEATAAAVFTSNRMAAAPVILSKKHLANLSAQAVIINAGNANCCTGEQGKADASAMTEQTAEILKLDPESVVLASTGVIGAPLPMKKIEVGIKEVAKNLNENGSNAAAEAIMTTDTKTKEVAIQFELAGKKVTLGGIAKGSGMIDPDMATMLAVLTTDAHICKTCLQVALKSAVDKSFNMITVDGETSTNDMVVLLSNGHAGNEKVTLDHSEMNTFQHALDYVCTELAKMIAKDGEGITKFLKITVKGAPSWPDAKLVGKTVANSNLVKTAFFGEDANWGRIIGAIGYSEGAINPEKIDIYFGDEQIVKNSQSAKFSASKVKKILKSSEIDVVINLKNGEAEATVWTTDLSYDYVKINADYTT